MGANTIEAPFGRLDLHMPVIVLDSFLEGVEDLGHGGIFTSGQMSASPWRGTLLLFGYFCTFGVSINYCRLFTTYAFSSPVGVNWLVPRFGTNVITSDLVG